MKTSKPDVFLSYNREDQGAVEKLARRFRELDIEPWMENKDWIFSPRLRDEIKTALDQCRSCLVFIGTRGIKPWLNSEIQAAIYNRMNEVGFHVIPVLLPGADREGLSDLPAFEQSTQWVEFPKSLDDEESFRHLLALIKPARAVKKTILLPDIDWVEIPAGEFIYGEASEKQTLTLDRFFIGRYLDSGRYNSDASRSSAGFCLRRR